MAFSGKRTRVSTYTSAWMPTGDEMPPLTVDYLVVAGGGGGGGNNTYNGQAGGSGVVILRYPNAYTITIGAGLTGSTTTVSSNKVTTITAGSGNVSWS
jgi:hypothetical protein